MLSKSILMPKSDLKLNVAEFKLVHRQNISRSLLLGIESDIAALLQETHSIYV